MIGRPPSSTLFPYAPLSRSGVGWVEGLVGRATVPAGLSSPAGFTIASDGPVAVEDLSRDDRFGVPQLLSDHGVVAGLDRKSTRLNSSHGYISYAVFCLKKKT